MEESERQELELQMECTKYFQEHPHVLQSCEELVLHFGSSVDLLEHVLNRLVSLQILEMFEHGPRSVYRYKLPKLTIREGLPWTNT